MKHENLIGGGLLIGLLVVSIGLYWAADTGSGIIQGSMLALLAAIALGAVWLWR